MVKEARRTRGPHEATEEEWQAMVEKNAQHYLGISAEEFTRKWRAGEFENPDRPEVLSVGMLLGIPFGK